MKRAVKEHAEQIARRAEANLAAHRKTGDARVTLERDGRTDWHVYLDNTADPGLAALALEFGHTDENGREVPGLYILYRAAGLV